MSRSKITLRTTEFIGGEKKTVGDVVELDENDPIAVKTRELEAVERAANRPSHPAG